MPFDMTKQLLALRNKTAFHRNTHTRALDNGMQAAGMRKKLQAAKRAMLKGGGMRGFRTEKWL